MTFFRHKLALWIAAAGVLLLLPALAPAATIDKVVNVNVFVYCDNSGANCASTGPSGDLFFATEVNKIWAQAGIQVDFTLSGYRDSTNYMNIDDASAGHKFCEIYNSCVFNNLSSTVETLLLVHTIAGAYGEGWIGAGGMVIAMDTVMAYNSGAGRLDTIAHELGHNLGLVPGTSAEFDGSFHDIYANDLMASGGIRNTPTALNQISTDGLTGLDRLPADQVTTARASDLLQNAPEPGTWLLMSCGMGGILLLRRRNA